MKLVSRLQRSTLQRAASLPEAVLARILGPAIVSPDGGTPLGREAQILLRATELVRRREAFEIGYPAARLELDHSAPIVDYQGIDVRWTDRTLPGPAGRIRVRSYEPRGWRARRPVLVFFHGGGWAVGSIKSHEGVCRALATKADAIVVSVAYRLAPEHKFPAAVEDAVAATRWVLAEAASLGGDPSRVAVGGDSAGGNLAAVVAQETRGDAVRPVFQLLVYPATELTRQHRSHTLFREGFMLTKRGIDAYLAAYLNHEPEQFDPRASPLFTSDLRGLPPALVLTAGFDPLRDEGRAYAQKMRAAGVDVTDRCVEETIHGFFSFGGVFAHAAREVDFAAAALRNAFAKGETFAKAG